MAKPSNMEIKVTSCADCPYENLNENFESFCNHPKVYEILIVEDYFDNGTVHPSCPLKQQSITVKLETDDK